MLNLHKQYLFCRLFKQYVVLFFVNQMASALFRLIAGLGRNMIVANTFGAFALLVLFVLGGFVLSKGTIDKFIKSSRQEHFSFLIHLKLIDDHLYSF